MIDKADLDPPEKLLELIKQHLPTHVILNFKHKNEVAKKKGGKKRLKLVAGNMGDITKIMFDEEYLDDEDVLDKKDQKNSANQPKSIQHALQIDPQTTPPH